MTHKRFWLIAAIAIPLALLAAFLFVPQTALAQSGGGSGTLSASGDGLAGIRGSGTVTISGNGILWIKDHAGDASIHVSGNGVRRDLSNGWIRYTGFQGQAQVSGSMISVALSGYDIHLQASGTGHYVLRGHGTYSVENDGLVILQGAWTEEIQVHSLP
jgi:hypothetical protein